MSSWQFIILVDLSVIKREFLKQILKIIFPLVNFFFFQISDFKDLALNVF